MGASSFYVERTGTTAADAFSEAVDDAYYEYGHGGYTGSIAEKNSFRIITLPEGKKLDDLIQSMESEDYCDGFNPYDDKYGPAGCVDLGETKNGKRKYAFFGVASY